MGAYFLRVAPHGGAAAAADLADAQPKQLFPHTLIFPGGNDHARIGYCQTDAGGQLGEGAVVDAAVELTGVDVVGPLDPGDADGVGPDAMDGLQVLRVHQQARELVFIQLQPEQHAQAHVVDAALHGPVVGLGVVGVIVLRPRGMQLQIALLVIGFLEQDVGADARLFQLAVVLHRGGRDVDVDPTDIPVFMVDGVDGLDAVEDVFDGIVHRVLARFDGQALVAHVLQGDHLGADLLLGQLLPGDVLVFQMVGTVEAAVDAVIGEIQRRENHDAVAVVGHLDFFRDLVHPLDLLRHLAGQQNRRLPVGQAGAYIARRALFRTGFFQNLVDERDVVLVRLRVGQGFFNLLIVDKFFRFQGLGIILCHFENLPFFEVSVRFPLRFCFYTALRISPRSITSS